MSEKNSHARENVRKKKSCKGKCPKKKVMQGKMSEKKSHAQDGPHFDMKP